MVAVPTHSDLKPKKLNHKTSLLEEGASRWWEVGPPPDPAPCGQKESQHWPHFQYSLIAHSGFTEKIQGIREHLLPLLAPDLCLYVDPSSLPSLSAASPRVRAYVLSHSSRVQLCVPVDCSPLGSPVHGMLQARTLEWVSMPSSRGSW